MTDYTSTTSNQPSPAMTLEALRDAFDLLVTRPLLNKACESWLAESIAIPIPNFIPMPFPKLEAPQLRYEMLWGCPIIDPRKTAIIHAGMALDIPDSRPTPLRWTLRYQGYRAYAKVKRQRRERKVK